MQASKINLLFKNDVGFYLLTALLLIAVSFLAFVCESFSQKIICILITGYFAVLLLKICYKFKTSSNIG
ncbi:competence protein ComEC [Lactobacillus helveticus MTCC 5463]|nr:competence protein ComEC [Lactobacillus helveticus MTCC 5463]